MVKLEENHGTIVVLLGFEWEKCMINYSEDYCVGFEWDIVGFDWLTYLISIGVLDMMDISRLGDYKPIYLDVAIIKQLITEGRAKTAMDTWQFGVFFLLRANSG